MFTAAFCRHPRSIEHPCDDFQGSRNLQQSVQLSPDEQDALDGLLLLRQPTPTSSENISLQSSRYPHYQTYYRHIKSRQGSGAYVQTSSQTRIGSQPRSTSHRASAGRTFAAAAAAASRSQSEYPIFSHHQPQRAVKAAAQQSNSMSSGVRRQSKLSYGCQWPDVDGHVQRGYRSHGFRSPHVSTASRAAHSHHEDVVHCHQEDHQQDAQAATTHLGLDNLHARINEEHMGGFHQPIRPWNASSQYDPGYPRTRQQTPSDLDMGIRSRTAYNLNACVAQDPNMETNRGFMDRLAFAG